MQFTEFDTQVGDLTAALGDATRRGIYITVRSADEPVTVAQIADLFAIHPNVARHHLDRLVSNGYLAVTHRRPEGRSGPGAGRPAKHYEATDKEVSISFPQRRYELLSELLVQVIERLAPDEAIAVAVDVGREFGRGLAAEIGLPEDAGFEQAVQAVAKALLGVGFGAEADPEHHTIITRFCPFGTTAQRHPEIVCKIDQGIVEGLLEAARHRPIAMVTPHSAPDEVCVTDVTG